MRTAHLANRSTTVLALLCAMVMGAQPVVGQAPATNILKRTSVQEKLEKRGDLILRNTPLTDALAAITKVWGVNFAASSELEGVVTGTYDGSTLREVLQTILITHGYSYQVVGQTIVVAEIENLGLRNPRFVTETIPLRYTSAVDLVKAAQHLVSVHGKVAAIESANALLVIDAPERIADVKKFVSQVEEANERRRPTAGISATQVDVAHIDLQYVKAETILKTVETALGKDGKIAIDLAENRLVIKDTVGNLRIVEKLIENLDIPRPQVRITALIYDVGLRDLEEIGVNWNSILKFDFDADNNPRQVIDLESVQRIPFLGSPIDSALTIASLNKNFDLVAVVSALSEANDSRLLADPMISVLNNEEALFQSVEEIPFQELTETSAGGNIGTTSFKEVGIELKVTPQIANDGTVQLTVNPVFSRLTGFTPNTDQPIVDRRETSTRVRVRDGQTFVLGGMRRRTETHTYTGVPYLKDIQFLHIGKLFRSRNDEVRESELLVFIKTDIVTPTSKKLPREEMADHAGAEMLNRVPSALDIWPVGPFGHSIESEESDVHDFSEQLEAEPIPPPTIESSSRRDLRSPGKVDSLPSSDIARRERRWSSFNPEGPYRQRQGMRQNPRYLAADTTSDFDRVTRLPAVVEQNRPVGRIVSLPMRTESPASLRGTIVVDKPSRPRPNIWLALTLARK